MDKNYYEEMKMVATALFISKGWNSWDTNIIAYRKYTIVGSDAAIFFKKDDGECIIYAEYYNHKKCNILQSLKLHVNENISIKDLAVGIDAFIEEIRLRIVDSIPSHLNELV
jgi:hypothetical protein